MYEAMYQSKYFPKVTKEKLSPEFGDIRQVSTDFEYSLILDFHNFPELPLG